MATALDTIVTADAQEPPELPRLTTANTFITYDRMLCALGFAIESAKKIPEANPQRCTEALKEVIRQCEITAKAAARLIEANR